MRAYSLSLWERAGVRAYSLSLWERAGVRVRRISSNTASVSDNTSWFQNLLTLKPWDSENLCLRESSLIWSVW